MYWVTREARYKAITDFALSYGGLREFFLNDPEVGVAFHSYITKGRFPDPHSTYAELVESATGGTILTPEQIIIINGLRNNRSIISMPRRVGTSTVLSAHVCAVALNSPTTILYSTHNQCCPNMVRMLGLFTDPIKSSNIIHLANGSRIIIDANGSTRTTRGYRFDIAVIDRTLTAQYYYGIAPCLKPNSQLIFNRFRFFDDDGITTNLLEEDPSYYHITR